MTTPTARRSAAAVAALIAALLLVAPAHAALLVQDDFEAQTPGAAPSGNGWTTTATTATQFIRVVDDQSDFGPAGHGRAVLIDDNDNSAGLFSPNLRNSTAVPTNALLRYQFDFKLGSASQNPAFTLFDAANTNAITFGFAWPGTADIYYVDGSGARVNLDTAVVGDWYRATLMLDPLDNTVDSWSLRLQRHDGTSVVSDQLFADLDFRNDVSNLANARFLFNTTPSQFGEMTIDNFSIAAVPEPTTGLALLAAGALTLTVRRRR